MFSIKRTVSFLIVALFSTAAVYAADDRISEIVIKGNKLTDTSAIMLVIKSKTGEALSAEKVNQDVKAIYKMGRFQDVNSGFTRTDKGVVL
ncbi:MAG: POTRA domain-containing protein [Deltaproteobacteria bacterium]